MQRLRAVFRRFKNVAGAIIGTGLLPYVPRLLGLLWHRVEDVETAYSLWTQAGGDIPTIVRYVSSPFFGPALIILGFVWAGARWKAEHDQAPAAAITITDRIGWTIVAATILGIFGTTLFDEFLVESHAPQFARYAVDQNSERGMTKNQFDRLIATFAPVAKELPPLTVEAVSAASNAAGYAQIFMTAFHVAGMTVNGVKPDDTKTMLFPSQASVSSPQMRGLFIGVPNSTQPSANAEQFKSLLKSAGFDASYASWQGLTGDTYVFVVSFK